MEAICCRSVVERMLPEGARLWVGCEEALETADWGFEAEGEGPAAEGWGLGAIVAGY